VTHTTDGASLAATLRAATASTHRALERRLDAGGPGWSRERYACFLRATLDVVAHLEEPVADGLRPYLPGWHTRRAERLRADLARLGADAGCGAPAPGAMAPAGAFGAAYVLRGSELGAPFIARAITACLDLRAEDMSYLHPGPGDGPTWPEFVAALDAFGARHPHDRPGVVAAAQHTFAAFERAFAREGFA
jgi:heme oxygenase